MSHIQAPGSTRIPACENQHSQTPSDTQNSITSRTQRLRLPPASLHLPPATRSLASQHSPYPVTVDPLALPHHSGALAFARAPLRWNLCPRPRYGGALTPAPALLWFSPCPTLSLILAPTLMHYYSIAQHSDINAICLFSSPPTPAPTPMSIEDPAQAALLKQKPYEQSVPFKLAYPSFYASYHRRHLPATHQLHTSTVFFASLLTFAPTSIAATRAPSAPTLLLLPTTSACLPCHTYKRQVPPASLPRTTCPRHRQRQSHFNFSLLYRDCYTSAFHCQLPATTVRPESFSQVRSIHLQGPPAPRPSHSFCTIITATHLHPSQNDPFRLLGLVEFLLASFSLHPTRPTQIFRYCHTTTSAI